MTGRARAGAFVLLMAPALAAAAGFDCARASLAAEKAVCAAPELSGLDDHLSRYYAAARTALVDASPCLQADQQRWLQRRNACRDDACLRAAYLDRLAELDALQPGASALRNVELPARPALAWIVPAALDKVAAAPNPRARPAEVMGTLVDEVSGGDGFVLRTPSGERHVLVQLMFIDGKTSTQLQALSRQQDATYVARGYLANESGRRDFEPSRCVFIHRAVAAAGRVLADGAKPVAGFKPHELAFATPTDGVARAESRSEPFFAVILRTALRCTITEAERAQVQALFPRWKVFMTRFECEDGIEEHITYTGADPKFGFLAIHGGTSASEAGFVLEAVKQSGRFPGANLRRMQAVKVSP
jgi:uncharacterized protein